MCVELKMVSTDGGWFRRRERGIWEGLTDAQASRAEPVPEERGQAMALA